MLLQPLCRARLHVWGHAGGRGRGAALSLCAPCPCANSGVCPAGVRSATDSPVEPGRSSRLRHGVGGCRWPCGHAVSLFPQQRGRCDCPAGGWWSSWGPQHRGGGRTGSVGSATVLGPEWAGLPASELASGRVTAWGAVTWDVTWCFHLQAAGEPRRLSVARVHRGGGEGGASLQAASTWTALPQGPCVRSLVGPCEPTVPGPEG